MLLLEVLGVGSGPAVVVTGTAVVVLVHLLLDAGYAVYGVTHRR